MHTLLAEDLRILSAGRLPTPAAVGAVLIDLAIDGHLRLVDGQLHPIADVVMPPPVDELAADVLASIVLLGPAKPKVVRRRLGRRHRKLARAIDARLLASGALGDPFRFAGIPLGADRPTETALDQVRRQLHTLTDGPADLRTIALGRLVGASRRWRRAAPDRAMRRGLTQALACQATRTPTGPADAITTMVEDAVRATTDAVSFAIVATVVASSSGGDG